MMAKKGDTAPVSESVQAKKLSFLLLLVAVLVTAVIYIPSLKNGLTNWDDEDYITNNTHIGGLTSENVKYHFTHFYMGNYHPLTMLSYCMDYKKPLKPAKFHTTNYVLHILNTSLVFLFVFLLTQSNLIAVVAALLFGIHPMHVESVAWASERKDVLYTLFFMASLCSYVYYITFEKNKLLGYILTTLFFVLSLLSKGQAVVLPLLLILIDVFLEKKLQVKSLLPKLPWFILSLIFGVIAIKAQQSFSAISSLATYGIIDRMLFGFYGITAYLHKLVLPMPLSCFYPFPTKDGGSYTLSFYISPLIAIGIAISVWYFFRRNKYVVFAALFFIASIFIVLQLVPIGAAVIADRYTYIPYLGFFILAGKLFSDAWQKKFSPVLNTITLVLCLGFIVFFSFSTSARINVWKDSLTLWNDAISKSSASPKIYLNRGKIFIDKKMYDKAVLDLNEAIRLNGIYADAYYNRGLAFYYLRNFNQSINDYTRAIECNPKLAVAYYNRAGTYFVTSNYKAAYTDAVKAKELGYEVNPRFLEAIRKAGNF